MLPTIPTSQELADLMSASVFKVWQAIESFIMANYKMETLWDTGRKAGIYEYKFRRSGKTLCALYAREKGFGFMVIFGKAEREMFEASRNEFSTGILSVYDDTHQYHDGKWLMIDVVDDLHLAEIKKLIVIKKKPLKQVNLITVDDRKRNN